MGWHLIGRVVLNPRQREHAIARMERDLGEGELANGVDASEVKGSITKRDIIDAITDWKKLVTVMFNIFATLPVSAFSTFMPLVVQGMMRH